MLDAVHAQPAAGDPFARGSDAFGHALAGVVAGGGHDFEAFQAQRIEGPSRDQANGLGRISRGRVALVRSQ